MTQHDVTTYVVMFSINRSALTPRHPRCRQTICHVLRGHGSRPAYTLGMSYRIMDGCNSSWRRSCNLVSSCACSCHGKTAALSVLWTVAKPATREWQIYTCDQNNFNAIVWLVSYMVLGCGCRSCILGLQRWEVNTWFWYVLVTYGGGPFQHMENVKIL